MYKAKVGSKGYWMQGMAEYQKAEKEAERESGREASQTGMAASEP